MKAQLKTFKENELVYNLVNKQDAELFKILKYKEDAESFYNSIIYKTFKELQRRKKAETITKITNSLDVYEQMNFLQNYSHEEFYVIYLKRNNSIIKIVQISKGGMAGTVVDEKIIFKNALLLKASAMILIHNHPSGELRPSQADINITKKLQQASKLFNMEILDHVIISGVDGYYSLMENGDM